MYVAPVNGLLSPTDLDKFNYTLILGFFELMNDRLK